MTLSNTTLAVADPTFQFKTNIYSQKIVKPKIEVRHAQIFVMGKETFPCSSQFADHVVSVQVPAGRAGEERKPVADCGVSSISKAKKTPVNITV